MLSIFSPAGFSGAVCDRESDGESVVYVIVLGWLYLCVTRVHAEIEPRLPDNISFEEAATLKPFIVALNTFDRLKINGDGV